jgi:hypothetical protein
MNSLPNRMAWPHLLRFWTVGALCRCPADCVACRVPARRPGNFHLLVQMKVTKAKDPNATPLMRSVRCGTPAQRATWRQCGRSNFLRTRRRGPRQASPALIRWIQGQSAARPRRERCWADEQRCVQVARRAGQAEREERTERFCIKPLCFGDFHLGPQMKVTRPPGRDPAGNAVRRTETKRTNGCGPATAPSANRRSSCGRSMCRGSRPARWSH